MEVPHSHYDTLIPLLNATKSFEIFDHNKTYLETRELSFFTNYDLLIAHTFSSIPPLKFHFLWNKINNDIIAIDGTREAIFDNLDKLKIVCTKKTMVPYVKFVLDCVWSDKGSLRLTEDIEDIKFSDKLSEDDLQFLSKTIRPAKVTKNDAVFEIDCIIIYGTEVYQSNITLQENGIFEIVSETELRANMRCLRVIFLE